ncbi:MAG TPA: methyltransferase domain-containing protein [Candidatus Binatia bacterium]|jgi:2-polyprenyl-3-methyl-5-hydroxy-6-metoxy-1,4-benzoquinol methylase|nr:methyltransferase domain-containing protein [Candidatus Binatia bacterium]
MSRAQTWDPERCARNARFVTELAGPVVELLAPVAGERILDLGCGDGRLTEALVARGCSVVGVDLAPILRRADGTWHVDYVRLRFAADAPG